MSEQEKKSETVHMVVLVSRQVDGENVFVDIPYMSLDKKNVENYLINKPISQAYVIQGMQCVGEINYITAQLEI